MTLLDDWLQDRIRPPKSLGQPMLVLCRTDATVHAVRAWAAGRRGMAALDIATPRMLASQLEGPWLGERPPQIEAIPDIPFTRRMGDRPGLIARAEQWVERYRLVQAALPEVTAPEWLSTLAASDWRRGEGWEARLLDLARSQGRRLTASLSYGNVVSIGFDGPLDPWTRALHEALAGPVRIDTIPRALPQSTIQAPDPTAEARLVAQLALAHPTDTLVLVQHDATAARVHRALLRNGIPSAWRGSFRLERHTLATVIRRAVPWFTGSSDPSIRATDLHFVLRHPLVGDRLPPPAQTWLEQQLLELGEVPDADKGLATHLTARGLTAAVKRARHLDAPLSQWLAETRALIARTDEAGTAQNAARLHARLGVIKAAVEGLSMLDVFPVGGPEEDLDWGDFDAEIARLLDQTPAFEEPVAPRGTLGALRRMFLAFKVRSRDDPAAFRILGALKKGRELPATRATAVQMLQGTTDRRITRDGVSILAYEDYDGRPCTQLVLCDVHDQGVAARPRPDPLLSDDQIAALGLLDGRSSVDFRLDQLQRAVARATHSTVLLIDADTMGRAVVAPVQLRLAPASRQVQAQGRGLLLPEHERLAALAVTAADAGPSLDDRAADLALQARVEWWRAGRGLHGRPGHPTKIPGEPTLAHLLAERPAPKEPLGAWLGDTRGVPQGVPDDAERSHSSFFKPLTHCLYQAFARTQLGIQEAERVTEDLDPKELGTVAHKVLEEAIPQGSWAHDGEPVAAMERFRDALQGANGPSFASARESFGALSEARLLATQGQERRWRFHWAEYAAQRTLPVRAQPAWRDLTPWIDETVKTHHVFARAVAALERELSFLGLEIDKPIRLSWWLSSLLGRIGEGSALAMASTVFRDGLPLLLEPALRTFVASKAFLELQDVRNDLIWLAHAIQARVEGRIAELPFGLAEGGRTHPPGTLHDRDGSRPITLGPVTLTLVSGDRTVEVKVKGAIDRILLVEHEGHRYLRLVDYKTAAKAPTSKQGRLDLLRLRDAQLVIYALVLQQARHALPPAWQEAAIATLGWDHPRAAEKKGGRLVLLPPEDRFLIDRKALDLLARSLHNLVARAQSGDWSLSPRADTCPQLQSYAHDHCPYVGACRFRDLPKDGA